jgi:hypothetical protein
MPNCFSLTSKRTGQVVPLEEVDKELCAMLGVEVHPKRWVEYWYDIIGFQLACGKTWEELHANAEDDEAEKKIVTYLEENFIAKAWFEHKGAR